MPAFDPVRDAVLNSPIGQTAPMLPLPSPSSTLSSPMASPSLGRRATDLSVLLNSHSQEPSLRTPPPLRSSTLSHLLHSDDYFNEDKLDTSQPLTRSRVESIPVSRKSKSMFSSSPSPTRESPVSRSRPSSSSSSVSMSFPNQFNNPVARLVHSNPMPPPPPPPPQPATIPYNPKVRITPPTSVLIPLSPAELEAYKDYRYQGRGSAQLANVGKRKRSTSPRGGDSDQPPAKRLHGDVGVVMEHCKHVVLKFHLLFTSCATRQLQTRRGCCTTSRFAHYWPQELQQLGEVSSHHTVCTSRLSGIPK